METFGAIFCSFPSVTPKLWSGTIRCGSACFLCIVGGSVSASAFVPCPSALPWQGERAGTPVLFLGPVGPPALAEPCTAPFPETPQAQTLGGGCASPGRDVSQLRVHLSSLLRLFSLHSSPFQAYRVLRFYPGWGDPRKSDAEVEET